MAFGINELRIIDVSNPTSPQQAAFVDGENYTFGSYLIASDIYVTGNLVYITVNYDGLYILRNYKHS